LRSRFDPSIEFVFALVWIISMGKNLGLLRSWDEFGRPGDGGSGTTLARWTSWAGQWPAGPRAVEPPLATTRATRRHRAGPVRRFQPMAEKKNKKGCLFFNLF
jgi:hypothetical protein